MIREKELKKKEMYNVMIESLQDKKRREVEQAEQEAQERLKYKEHLKNLEQRKEQLHQQKLEKDKIKEMIYE